MVKNPPANARDVGSIPGWEDPVEKEMAILSSILAWEIPWREEPSGLQSIGSQRVGHNLVIKHACIVKLDPIISSILRVTIQSHVYFSIHFLMKSSILSLL